MGCPFKIVRGIARVNSGDKLIGFECLALQECEVYRTPGATYELGLINGAFKEKINKEQIFILTTVELFMNLSYYNFQCTGVNDQGEEVQVSLIFPSLEEKTTVIPYYRICLNTRGKLAMTEPFKIVNDDIIWAEPCEVYMKAFSEIYDRRIAMHDVITRCEENGELAVQGALFYALLMTLKKDTDAVRGIKS